MTVKGAIDRIDRIIDLTSKEYYGWDSKDFITFLEMIKKELIEE